MNTQRGRGLRPTLALLLTATLLSSATALAKGDNELDGKVSFKDKKGNPITDASNAVVFIEEVKGDISKPAATPPAISSKNKEFEPVVLPIVKGTTVDFPNDDMILHNVFSLSKIKPFDLGLYKKGQKKSVTFDKGGIVKVYCNIHEKMAAYIIVLDNPFYSLTTSDGGFNIKHLPDGNYTVSVWQRYGPLKSKTIAVNDSKKTNVDFTLEKGAELNFDMIQDNPNALKHTNKFGKEYPSNY